MVALNKRFDYTFSAVNDLNVQTEQDLKTGRPKVTAVLVNDEPIRPTDRFWLSLYSRFGFNQAFWKYFTHAEVLNRIAEVESDRIRICIERDAHTGDNRLLAVTSPNKPIVQFDDLVSNLERYDGQDIQYLEGVVESKHTPRAGANSFHIAGDEFSNRFVMSVPIDGYGLPNIYLSLLRHICANGAVGYAKAFRSNLALGRGNDDVNYSIVRALDGFNNDEGFAALRERFTAAAQSWASVNEAQSLYKQLLKLNHHQHLGWDGAALVGESAIAKLLRQSDSASSTQPQDGQEHRAEISSPILTAFNRMTGEVPILYGIANPDALSIKRQRTLPVKCRIYDLLNFASEVATHHANEFGSRSAQAWIGSLISAEYDLENSAEAFGEFRDFFLDRKLDGETALELQRVTA